jgi:bacterial/archaeal transporter family protein
MTGWIVPTLGYVLLLGAAGVTARLSLRTISWEQMVLWVPVAYLFFAIVLAAARGARFPLGIGGFWAAATAFCAAGALVLFFYALTQGEASTVVPMSSAYPLVTLVGAALFLSEQITIARVVGAILVVAGVIVISR